MATQLPATASEQRIWHLCQRLEFFASHLPLALQKLGASSTNDNYYVHTQRGHYLLRHYSPHVTGVCRQQELRCQHAAAAVGVAPAPLCLNNHQRILISEFLTHSRHFDWEQMHHLLPQLVQKLVNLHRLKVQTPQLEPEAYLVQLAEKARQGGWSDADDWDFAALINVARQFAALPSDIVLCHLDLHSGNILLQHQQIYLIDYEYCQLADSSLDLAALSLNLQMDIKEERALIEAYQKFRPHSNSTEKIPLAKLLYSGFCWLWFKTLPGATDKVAQAQQTLSQLFSSNTA